MDALAEIVRRACIARRAEEALERLMEERGGPKMVHLSIGEELLAAALAVMLPSDVAAFTHHRSHMVAYAFNPDRAGELVCEFAGRPGGVHGGRMGGMELHVGRVRSEGILGGALGRALGYALAGGKALAYIGEGTLTEGVFHEALNIAGLKRPWLMVVVVRNMGVVEEYSGTYIAFDLRRLAESHGLAHVSLEAWRLDSVVAGVARALDWLRAGRPVVVEAWAQRATQHYGPGEDRWLGADFRAYSALARFTLDWLGGCRGVDVGVECGG